MQESTCVLGAMLSTAAWTAIGALPTQVARNSFIKSASEKRWLWTRMLKTQSRFDFELSVS